MFTQESIESFQKEYWQFILGNTRKRFPSNSQFLPLMEEEALRLQQVIYEEIGYDYEHLKALDHSSRADNRLLSASEDFLLYADGYIGDILSNVRAKLYIRGDVLGSNLVNHLRDPMPRRLLFIGLLYLLALFRLKPQRNR